MKKSLIALAALAVVSAASAQSSVTVYGVADVGFKTQTITDGVNTTKASGVADGAMAGQRFGFKGTEDLGGGLAANFVIEQGLSMTSAGLTNARTSTSLIQTDSASSLTGRSTSSINRQSYVGLSSATMGQIRLGYQYTNVYELSTLAGFNLGAEGVTGADTAHTFGNAMVGGTRANAITYISPTFSGVSAQLQYGAATGLNNYETTIAADAAAVVRANRTSALLNYANGPLTAKLAYTRYVNATGTAPVAAVAGNPAFGAEKTGTLTQVGASYDFGRVIVAGTYNNGEDGAAGTANATWKSQQIGLKVPYGAWAFIATAGTGTTKSAAAGTINDIKQNQLAVQYSLSKRSTLYVYTGTTKNSGTATASIDKNTSTIAGINHTF